jgi:hypothetical protein
MNLPIVFMVGFGAWYYFKFIDPTLITSVLGKPASDFPGAGMHTRTKEFSKDLSVKRQQAAVGNRSRGQNVQPDGAPLSVYLSSSGPGKFPPKQ